MELPVMIKNKLLFIAFVLIVLLAINSVAHADECHYPTQHDLSAVVKVSTGAGASGTGTYINDHQLVTAAHILPANSTQMVAFTNDDSFLIVRVLDPFLDVAIFDVYPKDSKEPAHPAGITPIKLSTKPMNFGDDLYVAGHVRLSLIHI